MEGGVAVLRQLVGQIQELWEIFGPTSLDQRWYLLGNGSMSDDHCGLISDGKSEVIQMEETNKCPPSKKSRRERNREKGIVPSSSNDVMNQQIWKELPQDLFEAVIARLPIATFFRFRVVCQKWNSLLASNSFSKHCSEVVRENPWFYAITHENENSGAMYDPSLKKWYHPSLPFLSGKMIILPVASAGGLVCFLDIGHRYFYVCNPLTDSVKELPPRAVTVWARVAVGMILNGKDASGGYKIVWLGSDGVHEMYDSLSNTWSRPGSVPPSIKLPLSLNFRSQTLTIGSTLYFMRADPDGIVSYDVSSGAWKQFIIPSPRHLTDYTLAEYGGQIMLVGLLSKNAATCVCIWELQKMTLLWKEVDRMPNIWCLEFYGKHVRMTCLGNSGMLMLSLRSNKTNRLVSYDVTKKEWSKVPDCLFPNTRHKQWIACGTAFHPCPTAIA